MTVDQRGARAAGVLWAAHLDVDVEAGLAALRHAEGRGRRRRTPNVACPVRAANRLPVRLPGLARA